MADIVDVVMRITDLVTPSLNDIREHLIDTRNQHRHLAREINGVSRSLGSMADAMAPIAGASAAIGAIGVKSFMDFDATVTAAGVKAGATSEELEQMRAVAGKLGAEFPISANDAAEGMDRLAAGGFNAQQVMGAMPAIIEASVASGEDLAATSDVITSALDIWNLRTGDVAANTTHVADVIQAAANSSKLGMQDFGLAMQYAGAPAATLGISIEELGAAMGVMANNGIEASTIGTSLRATLSRLSAPPKDAAAAIAALGLQTKDSSGNFIGLNNVIEQLRNSMSGLSDTEQVAMAKSLAGEDAYSGLLALVRTSPEAYAQVADAINDSAGSSEAAFNKMNDTLKGSVDQLKGAAESAAIALGQALAPQIRTLAGYGQTLATALTDMSPGMRTLIIGAGEGAIALTGLLFASSKVVGIAGTMIGIYGDIGRVLNNQTIGNRALQYAIIGVRDAYGFVSGAASSAIAAIRGAETASGTASLATTGGWTRVRAAVSYASTSISASAASAKASMLAMATSARASVVGAFSTMRARVAADMASMRAAMTWGNITNSASAAMASLSASATAARTSVVASFTAMRASAMASMASMRASVTTAASNMIGRLTATATAMKTTALAAVATARSFSFSGALSAAASGLANVARNAVLATISMVRLGASFAISSVIGGVATAFRTVAGAIAMATRASLAFALSPVGLAIMALAGTAYLLYTHWAQVSKLFQGLGTIIRTAFMGALNSVRPALNNLQAAWQRLMGVFQQHSATINMIISIFKGIALVMGGVVVANIYILASVLTGVLTAAFDVVAAVVNMGLGVFTGLVDFITGVFTGNWSAAWNGVVEIFSSIFGGIAGIAEGVLNGVKAAINAVIGGINSISVSIPDWVPGVGGSTFGPLGIPYLARGTDNWFGGPAVINERGAEIVDLPSGARVIPHDQSLAQAYRQGAMSSGGEKPEFNIYISGVTVNNGQDIKEIAMQVAREIEYKLETNAVNLNVGAI